MADIYRWQFQAHFIGYMLVSNKTWWRYQMETFSALLALCAGNSPVTGEFPSQRAVTQGFDAFFHLRLNKPLSKQSWGWWLETPSCSLWRHYNYFIIMCSWGLNWQLVSIGSATSLPPNRRQCITRIRGEQDVWRQKVSQAHNELKAAGRHRKLSVANGRTYFW